MNAYQKTIQSKLKEVSTATIATALFKRGLRNQFIQNVKPLHTKSGNGMIIDNF